MSSERTAAKPVRGEKRKAEEQKAVQPDARPQKQQQTNLGKKLGKGPLKELDEWQDEKVEQIAQQDRRLRNAGLEPMDDEEERFVTVNEKKQKAEFRNYVDGGRQKV